MRTYPAELLKGDRLSDGGVVESDQPTDHGTYLSVIVKYGEGNFKIRDFDRARSIEVGRTRITFGPTGQGRLDEDDRANRAADAYERQIGL